MDARIPHPPLALLYLTGTRAAPAPPVYNLVARSAPTAVPGIYIIQISLPPTCQSTAQVRLESYLGDWHPRVGWTP